MGMIQIKGIRAESFSVAAPMNAVYDKLCDARVWFASFPLEDRAPRVALLDGGNARGRVPGEGAKFSVAMNQTSVRTKQQGQYQVTYKQQEEVHQKVTLLKCEPAEIEFSSEAQGLDSRIYFHLTSTSQGKTNVTLELDTVYQDPTCGLLKSCASSKVELHANKAATNLQMLLTKELGNGFDT
eukprot:TRINITY_DN8544_c0_g1_i1.p1 TRINITY_DN8544_c0_g1~~TRINITY_DN8544_c0_g1_i1.p1  ORF type:complete len:201 (+),score=39.19 TRINITY_DN8544_c0_g1_i1:57-605(+)